MVNRPILIMVFIGVAAVIFLSLRSGFLTAFPPERPPVLKSDNSIVALADGSVMVAKPGTISRDVIDWFNDRSAKPTEFDIGPQPFVANSDHPEPSAEVRLDRFATELKAYPDVEATILVCSSTNSAADLQLAARRARKLKDELRSKQVEANRISTASCSSAGPAARVASLSDANEQTVRIALSHGS